MDKKPSSSKTSTSSKSEKRKADDKNETKINTGQSSLKKPKQELDIDWLLKVVKQQTEARHGKVYHDRLRYCEIHDSEDENTWEVGGCTVKRVQMKCKKGLNCEWYCEKCKVCAHQFECNCGDEPGLCVHVHFLCEIEGVNIEEDSEDESEEEKNKTDDESEEEEEKNKTDDEEEEEQNKIDATISACKSLLSDKKAEELLQKKLDEALTALQAHGQELKKEEEKEAANKKK